MDGGGGGHGPSLWSKHLGPARAGNARTGARGADGVGAGDTDGVGALGGGAAGRAMDGAADDTTEGRNLHIGDL